MSSNNGIKYFSKDISEIPYEILKKGLCWLRPIIIQFGYVNCNNQIDLVWFQNNEYRAQRLSFKEVDDISNSIGGKLQKKNNNLFSLKKDFSNLSMDKMKVMGILNLTPDSFSDGGQFLSQEKAISHAHKMRENGADIIDIGGESTKPGANYVAEEQEGKRILSVIKKLSKDHFLISADTRKPNIMEKAIDNGAKIINDISGMSDPKTPKIISKHGASIVIMHIQGDPKNMQKKPSYKFAPIEIYNFLEKKIDLALSEGVKLNCIAVDPGFGFGKNPIHNMQIMSWLPMFQSLGVPVLLGGSRKSSIGVLSNNELPENRLGGSIALLCYANLYGTQMIRVHDVLESKQAINISTHINKHI